MVMVVGVAGISYNSVAVKFIAMCSIVIMYNIAISRVDRFKGQRLKGDAICSIEGDCIVIDSQVGDHHICAVTGFRLKDNVVAATRSWVSINIDWFQICAGPDIERDRTGGASQI